MPSIMHHVTSVASTLLSTGGVQMEASSNYEDKSVTIFFKTSDNAWKARVVIFQATAHTKLYKSW